MSQTIVNHPRGLIEMADPGALTAPPAGPALLIGTPTLSDLRFPHPLWGRFEW